MKRRRFAGRGVPRLDLTAPRTRLRWLPGKRVVLVNLVLVVLAAAGGLWAYDTVFGDDADKNTGSAERLVAVTQGAVSLSVSATGSVASATTANANFVTGGTVTEIKVKVGDAVTKGQVLAKVDPSEARDELETAQANLAAARASLTRTQSSDADSATVAQANAQVAQASEEVDAAQRAVDGTVLTAPIAGTVITVSGAVGSTASSGSSSGGSGGSGSTSGSSTSGSSSSSSAFIQLADLSKMQVSANFAEADATKLVVGQAATATWNALSGARATAKVTSIAPTATTSNNVNTYGVVSTLDSVPDGARIGQSVTVAVVIAEAQNALRVPVAAVRTAGGQRTVRVRTGDVTETRVVEVGVEGSQYVEIKSGVSLGERVVVTTQTTTTSTRGTSNTGNMPGGGLGGQGGAPGGGR